MVGGGFAGFNAAGAAQAAGRTAEVVLVNPTDYFLYVPLLPEVAAGILDPRRVAVSLPAALPDVQLAVGMVHAVDLAGRPVTYATPTATTRRCPTTTCVLAGGSVNKLLPVPGVAEHAHGFRNLAEAVYLRDHLVRQVELADQADDTAERTARLTFVVVGAGYTGTEVAAQGVLAHPGARWRRTRGWRPAGPLAAAGHRRPGAARAVASGCPRTASGRWASAGSRSGPGTRSRRPTADGVRLSDGSMVPTRSLIWCVGVRPDPLVDTLGLPTERGRLVVDADLSVPGQPGLWACGDAAAVPDLTRPGEVTAMTAQHAQRQGSPAGKQHRGHARPRPAPRVPAPQPRLRRRPRRLRQRRPTRSASR